MPSEKYSCSGSALRLANGRYCDGGLVRQRDRADDRLVRHSVASGSHLGRKDVAAAGNCPEDRLRLVAKGATDVADTLGNAIVIDGDVGPDRLTDFVAVQQMPGVLYEKSQQAEGFMPKPDLLASGGEQGSPPEIEDESFELADRRRGGGAHISPHFVPQQLSKQNSPVFVTIYFREISLGFNPDFGCPTGEHVFLLSCAWRSSSQWKNEQRGECSG